MKRAPSDISKKPEDSLSGAYEDENVLTGRVLAGYGELEFELSRLFQLAAAFDRRYFDIFFRVKTQSERLEIAETLLAPKMAEAGLAAKFAVALGAVEYCRRLFDQYLCCHWFRRGGEIHFINLEAAAHAAPGAKAIPSNITDLELLSLQCAYFDYAKSCLIHLRQELAARDGRKTAGAKRPMPPPRDRPQLYRREAGSAG